jgi:hypothetical protein
MSKPSAIRNAIRDLDVDALKLTKDDLEIFTQGIIDLNRKWANLFNMLAETQERYQEHNTIAISALLEVLSEKHVLTEDEVMDKFPQLRAKYDQLNANKRDRDGAARDS